MVWDDNMGLVSSFPCWYFMHLESRQNFLGFVQNVVLFWQRIYYVNKKSKQKRCNGTNHACLYQLTNNKPKRCQIFFYVDMCSKKCTCFNFISQLLSTSSSIVLNYKIFFKPETTQQMQIIVFGPYTLGNGKWHR